MELNGFVFLPWICVFFVLLMTHGATGDASYSIPEEMKRGYVIGNIAMDLGLNANALSARKARIDSTSSQTRLCDINVRTGDLIVNERIDREELCPKKVSCVLKFELVLERPLELHHFTIQIQDVNDNDPVFPKEVVRFDIRESADKGAHYRVNEARDGDVGQNAVQSYYLEKNEHFILSVGSNANGRRNVELVLDRELDREQQDELKLILTASDGGTPPRSGTVAIHVTVLDANDNAPVFSQDVYEASISENSPLGSLVLTVSATDEDDGPNGHVTYEFSHLSNKARMAFSLDAMTGEVRVIGPIDFEEDAKHEIIVESKDAFGLSSDTKVIIHVLDVNDNPPVVFTKSINNPVPENSPPGTEVAIINVQDLDSGKNGEMQCLIQPGVPFHLLPSITNYYSLQTMAELDREVLSEYNVTITVIDQGSPALSSSKILHFSVADVNDNPPVFHKHSYSANVNENNKPGSSICIVGARDPDWRQNGSVIYSLLPGQVNGIPVSNLVSVNGDTGDVHAMRSFDYELFQSFEVHVMARDNGSPPLSSNVTVRILLSDMNDNPPQILYPTSDGNTFITEVVPKSIQAKALVSKVIAVDADSAQNAWLSYHMVKSTDVGLFNIGLHSGEIRTLRDISESDAMKQTLVVSVRDNGQPPLSATCTINLLISDNLSDIPELKDSGFPDDSSKITTYLIIALVSISTFFVTFIIIILAVRFCNRQKPQMLFDGALAVPTAYLPPNYADVDGTGTLHSVYNYDAYLTTGSLTSDFKFARSYNDGAMAADLTLTKSTLERHRDLLGSTDSLQVIS